MWGPILVQYSAKWPKTGALVLETFKSRCDLVFMAGQSRRRNPLRDNGSLYLYLHDPSRSSEKPPRKLYGHLILGVWGICTAI